MKIGRIRRRIEFCDNLRFEGSSYENNQKTQPPTYLSEKIGEGKEVGGGPAAGIFRQDTAAQRESPVMVRGHTAGVELIYFPDCSVNLKEAGEGRRSGGVGGKIGKGRSSSYARFAESPKTMGLCTVEHQSPMVHSSITDRVRWWQDSERLGA